MIVPLFVGREKSIRALEEVMKADKPILLATQKNAADDDPATDAIFTTGTLATRAAAAEAARRHRQGAGRGRRARAVCAYLPPTAIYEAEAEAIADEAIEAHRGRGAVALGVSEFENYVKLNKKISPEVVAAIPRSPITASSPTRSPRIWRSRSPTSRLLEIFNVGRQAAGEVSRPDGERDQRAAGREAIRTRVKRQMEKTQREYYLNEQMKAIQKELGDEDGKDELSELEKRIKKTKLSKEARDKAARRAEEAAQMSPMSAEATVVRNYLDWLLSIPCGKKPRPRSRRISRARRARRRPLRPGEGQGAHPRIPGRAAARQQAEGADPLPGRPARRRQDLARQVDRQGDGPRVRAHVAGRRARRGRDPRPPAHLHRLDARQGHPVDAQGQDLQPLLPARRDRQDGRTGAAIRRRRCWRCSTPNRTRPSTTTISRSTTTCRT
jgi:hypothetical protein